MFCPTCGNSLADNTKFCGNCGTKIDNNNALLGENNSDAVNDFFKEMEGKSLITFACHNC